MSESFRKMQIESSQKSAKSNKLLEKVGQNYQNNDSLEFRQTQFRETQEKEKMQKRLQLLIEGIGIEKVVDLSIDFMIYGADDNQNLSPEVKQFIKLSKEISSLMTKLACAKDIVKSSQDTLKQYEKTLDLRKIEHKILLEKASLGDLGVLATANEERKIEKLLFTKLDEFVIAADKLGISANKIISLLEKEYLTDVE